MASQKSTSVVRAGGKAPRSRKLQAVQDCFRAQLKHTSPTLRIESSHNVHESKPCQTTVKSVDSSGPATSTYLVEEEEELEEEKTFHPKRTKGKIGRAPAKEWTKEELKALLDIEFEVARKNIGEFTKSPILAARNASKVNNKLRQRHYAAIKALGVGSSEAPTMTE